MAFVKKTWKDRISDFPNRRIINDGIKSTTVTVSRNEGTVTEAGDSFNAANMNDLEDRIEQAISEGSTQYTAGENISLAGNVISVIDFMTSAEAHTLWANT